MSPDQAPEPAPAPGANPTEGISATTKPERGRRGRTVGDDHPTPTNPTGAGAGGGAPIDLGVTAGLSPAGTTEVLSSTPDGTAAAEQAARAPADWGNFGPPEPRPASWLRRLGARTTAVRRVAGHEWTWMVLGGLALAAALNWRALVDPAHTLPQDTQDPALIAYLIAWGGHALLHDPAQLWQLNAFFPAPYGLAYSDSLLGYAPLAMLGTGPEAAVLRYNLIIIGAVALTFIGGYALTRQLGLGRLGAAVAGLAWTVAPWRLAHAGHLNLLSAGGMALALAMLARGHGVRWLGDSTGEHDPAGDDDPDPGQHPDAAATGQPEPRRRPGWTLAGWLVAAWQITLGFGLGLVFAYVLLGAVVVGLLAWLVRRRSRPSWRLLLADAVGGIIFAGTVVYMALPYLTVFSRYPDQQRSAAWIELYSPPWSGLLTAPRESWLWGGLHADAAARLTVPGEMTLLPGFALLAMALAGLAFSVWSWRIRLALLVGTVVSVVLALGTNGPGHGRFGYLLLLHLPGFTGIRTSGRLMVWTTLMLALLAAGAVGALVARAAEVAQQRGLPRPTGPARLALLIPLALILVEGLGTTPHASVPPEPVALRQVAAPYLVLPTDSADDQLAMLWSTDRFADLVNGGSGIEPAELTRTREAIATFPDAASVDYLRGLGVKTVVVIPALAQDEQLRGAANLPLDGLGITRDEDGDTVVFHLTP